MGYYSRIIETVCPLIKKKEKKKRGKINIYSVVFKKNQLLAFFKP
jgi:hypothetical protein